MAVPTPAARLTDLHTCPAGGGPIIGPGSPNIIIEGLPAVRVGDLAMDGENPDPIVTGCPTVFFNNRMAVRVTDLTAAGGVITTGAKTVFIGNASSGECMQQAAANGAPFVVAG